MESGSRPGLAYLVTGRRAQHCTCPAGAAGDAVCQHRASVLAALGVLSAPDPEPPSAAACPACRGEGWTQEDHDGPYRCRACHGAGVLPAA